MHLSARRLPRCTCTYACFITLNMFRHLSTSFTTPSHDICSSPASLKLFHDAISQLSAYIRRHHQRLIFPQRSSTNFLSYPLFDDTKTTNCIILRPRQKDLGGLSVFWFLLPMHYFGLDPGEYRHGVSLRLSMIPNLISAVVIDGFG